MKNNFTKKLSLVIPAHNEEGSITETIEAFHKELQKNKIPHDILVVNDNSTDSTEFILKKSQKKIKELRYINNDPPNGFGFAVRKGFDHFEGDYVALVMADLSDSPKDLVNMYKTAIRGGYDCVFGSRFSKKAKVIDYPKKKLFFNRLGNNIIRIAFLTKYNDMTNAFKFYSKEVINGIKPFKSDHFNLTVEIPVKAITYGSKYTVVPTDWRNRSSGEAKLHLSKMIPKYLGTITTLMVYRYIKRGR